MNIMLVSVTERTSEIGLRKALGATRSGSSSWTRPRSAWPAASWGVATGLLAGYLIPRLTGIAVAVTPLPVLVAVAVTEMDPASAAALQPDQRVRATGNRDSRGRPGDLAHGHPARPVGVLRWRVRRRASESHGLGGSPHADRRRLTSAACGVRAREKGPEFVADA